MWFSRLFWKLFLVYVVLNLTLAAGFLVFVSLSQRKEINQQVEQRLLDTAIVLRSHVVTLLSAMETDMPRQTSDPSTSSELQRLIQKLAGETGSRMTIVDSRFNVLADSERDPSKMLDHANRPELIAAAEMGQGTATRPSPTLGIDMYYLALRADFEDGGFALVRVAERMDKINERVADVRRVLWTFVLSFATIGAIATYTVVGRIIGPLTLLTNQAQAIASGKDQAPVSVQSEDEVGVLAASFNRMQSELTRRFRQLRESNQQISTVLSSMDEGILAVDRNENLVLANEASKRMLNMPADNEVGRPLLAAVRSRPLQETVNRCLNSGTSIQTEFVSVGQPPRDLAVRATCLPGDPPRGVVVVLHDITELRRLENLRHEFVANVSHELKTPLASIKAYAETLRTVALDDPENNERFVIRIEEQADRLHQLIIDLLQIARVESGEEAFEITQVSVAGVASACIAEYRQSAEIKCIELVIEQPENAAVAMADEDGLRTILDNLVSNAIKYTPEHGKVTVQWHRDGSQVAIDVIDTGIGIAKEHQLRIFERFYRVDKARSRELGGTGLGLSIVKNLCQAFGGSVSLRSEAGEGTNFQVRLPAG